MRKEYDFSHGKRGAVVKAPATKIRITIRLDSEIVAWFKQQAHDAGGGNYQTLMNNALRDNMQRKPELIVAAIRKVIREELNRAS